MDEKQKRALEWCHQQLKSDLKQLAVHQRDQKNMCEVKAGPRRASTPDIKDIGARIEGLKQIIAAFDPGDDKGPFF